ncbi:MAG: alpha/beta hydrolase, partial [Phycisphaeraceae bacterium]|nr:alpha/beta hydrolase [Phycisphaeraceae bacterium]
MIDHPRAERLDVPGGVLGLTVRGQGPLVVLLPGCGRPATDLDPLAEAIAAAGFEAVSMDYRGAGESRGLYAEPTLHAVAADAAAVIASRGPAPAIVVGHALGNRVARCLATDAPDAVRALVLIAAGGKVRP